MDAWPKPEAPATSPMKRKRPSGRRPADGVSGEAGWASLEAGNEVARGDRVRIQKPEIDEKDRKRCISSKYSGFWNSDFFRLSQGNDFDLRLAGGDAAEQ